MATTGDEPLLTTGSMVNESFDNWRSSPRCGSGASVGHSASSEGYFGFVGSAPPPAAAGMESIAPLAAAGPDGPSATRGP